MHKVSLLQQLGFRPYHMIEAVNEPTRAFSLAVEALNASYYPRNGEKAYGREEFDRWIGDFDVCFSF